VHFSSDTRYWLPRPVKRRSFAIVGHELGLPKAVFCEGPELADRSDTDRPL
jgi:hypothetical protein